MENPPFGDVVHSVDNDETVELQKAEPSADQQKTVELKQNYKEDDTFELKSANRRDNRRDNQDESTGLKRAKENDVTDETVELKRLKRNGNQDKTVKLERTRQNDDLTTAAELEMVKETDSLDEISELPRFDQNETNKLAKGNPEITVKLRAVEQYIGQNELDDKMQQVNKADVKDETAIVIDETQIIGINELKKDIKPSEHDNLLLVGGVGQSHGYKLKDIVPQGDAPCPRPPPGPAPPPPDLLDQNNYELFC